MTKADCPVCDGAGGDHARGAVCTQCDGTGRETTCDECGQTWCECAELWDLERGDA